MSSGEELTEAPETAGGEQTRSAFSGAFADLARSRDSTTSTTRRLIAVVAGIALVAAGIVAVGFLSAPSRPGGSGTTKKAETAVAVQPVVAESPKPSGSATASKPSASAAVSESVLPAHSSSNLGVRPSGTAGVAAPIAHNSKATYSAVSGFGCSGNNDVHNWYTMGYYTDGSEGWYETGGGYSGNGCTGRAVSMPMSGDADQWTNENYVVWWFYTSPVVEGTCKISVYIPNTGTARDVAGDPAIYKILGGRTSVTPYATFQINQTTVRGRWVTTTPVAVHNGAISVQLLDAGTDPNGEHFGAGQAKVDCTAG